MERKEFKSKLFSKKIEADDKDYWFYLYADVLYRLKQLTDLNCSCGSCFQIKSTLKIYLIKWKVKDT